MSDERVKIGGLMRCCLTTLSEERTDPDKPAEEGQILPCNYCNSSMIYKESFWVGNRPNGLD